MQIHLRVWALLLALAGVTWAGGREPFVLGADISWVPQHEAEGRVFSVGGTNADVLAILRTHGFNWARLRLFHTPQNPQGYAKQGWCDLPHTVAMAKRVKAAGFQLLLDFHYSDTWADPAHQIRPLAWRDLDDAALARAVGAYTREALLAFKAAGVTPEMVQIGNEITNGFLWRTGAHSETNWAAFSAELKAGIATTRAVAPRARVMLHLDCGGDNKRSRWFLDNAARHGVTFDLLGLSYYPKWHGPIAALKKNLEDLAARYPQPILVVEYTAPTFREPNELVHALPNGKGLGTFIWEPTGYGGPALFTDRGCAKPELELYPQLARDMAK